MTAVYNLFTKSYQFSDNAAIPYLYLIGRVSGLSGKSPLRQVTQR